MKFENKTGNNRMVVIHPSIDEENIAIRLCRNQDDIKDTLPKDYRPVVEQRLPGGASIVYIAVKEEELSETDKNNFYNPSASFLTQKDIFGDVVVLSFDRNKDTLSAFSNGTAIGIYSVLSGIRTERLQEIKKWDTAYHNKHQVEVSMEEQEESMEEYEMA